MNIVKEKSECIKQEKFGNMKIGTWFAVSLNDGKDIEVLVKNTDATGLGFKQDGSCFTHFFRDGTIFNIVSVDITMKASFEKEYRYE